MTLDLNHAINLLPSLEPKHYKVPLPECLQRAYMLDSGSPPPPFPSSLIADLIEEAIKKVGRDLLKALDGGLFGKGVVPKV